MTDQETIIKALGVSSAFDAAREAQRRTEFLAGYLREAGLEAYVLGISGGVDSLAAAMLAQLAVRGLRETGYDATFIGVRLPYGVQADETDAQTALDAIGADSVLRIDIKPAADAMLQSIREGGQDFGEAAREDFLLGNIKARQRMIAQYTVAGANRGLVIGTDHAAEALMGFFTKHGMAPPTYFRWRVSTNDVFGRSPPIWAPLPRSFRRSRRRPRIFGTAQAGRRYLRGDLRADRRFSRGQECRRVRSCTHLRDLQRYSPQARFGRLTMMVFGSRYQAS